MEEDNPLYFVINGVKWFKNDFDALSETDQLKLAKQLMDQLDEGNVEIIDDENPTYLN